MTGSSVVPGELGGEVGPQLGSGEVAHPVVRVRTGDAVLGVLVRPLRRRRGAGRSRLWGRHSAHRTPLRAAVAVVLAAATALAPALFSVGGHAAVPAAAAASSAGKTTFTVALTGDVDSLN